MTTTVEDVITIDRFKEIVKEETAWMEDEEFIDQFVDEHIDEYLRKRCLCLVDSLYINKLEKSAEEKVYTEAFDKGYAKGVKDTEEAWNRRAKIDEVVDNG